MRKALILLAVSVLLLVGVGAVILRLANERVGESVGEGVAETLAEAFGEIGEGVDRYLGCGFAGGEIVDGECVCVDGECVGFFEEFGRALEANCTSLGGELVDLVCVGATDVDCDGDTNAVDALKVLRHVASLSVTQEAGCADIGGGVQVTEGAFVRNLGDADCDGDTDAVDALKMLRQVAGLSEPARIKEVEGKEGTGPKALSPPATPSARAPCR